ncbi:MAG: hypothetical protein JOY99_00065 [Sphingomonadaceae bacterium]|nr:hypothetical protein [Sphingomonadaceae bacterium]
MLGKIIGALVGEKIAKEHGGDGVKGALTGAVAAALAKRLSLPALLALGGFAAYRKYKGDKAATA